MKIQELNKVTKYFRDRGYRGDFTGPKGHRRLIQGMEALGIRVPKIMRTYDGTGRRAGGMGLATPNIDATSAPSGNTQKTPSNIAKKKPVNVKKQKGLARPVLDPRDAAMQEIKQAEQPKGAVLPMQAAKGMTAITVGIGAPEPNLMEAEKGEPPIGATKEEVADDQHVMMSQGELVVPANVVRYHGLGTYESMRKEALMGLEGMEEAGQIEYVGEEKTSKSNDGGLLKAQTGVVPLGSAPVAASSQFAGLGSPTTGLTLSPLNIPNKGRPITDAQGNVIGYEGNTQPTPTNVGGAIASTTGIAAPNVGAYKKPVSADFTEPYNAMDDSSTSSTGTGATATSDSGSSASAQSAAPQQQKDSFDSMVQAEASKMPTGATAFNTEDYNRYINARTPAKAEQGLMGRAGDMVDNAAGFMLPFTGYQDKNIRESAADKLLSGAYGSADEYRALVNTVSLPAIESSGFGFESGVDDTNLVNKLNNAKKVTFNDTSANQFNKQRSDAIATATTQMNKPLFSSTPADSVLLGKDTDATRANARAVQDRAMNPITAAEDMKANLPDPMAGQRDAGEQDRAQRDQEEAARQAAAFDKQRNNTILQRAEDNDNKPRGSYGATGSIFDPGGLFGGPREEAPSPFSEPAPKFSAPAPKPSANITSSASENPEVQASGLGGFENRTDSENDQCVIATHGMYTGGFSKLEKAKAEIWCAKTYHGKWYGEAFRRGYRAAGQRCIDSGRAHEHYQEFKDFVAYGRGVKKGFGLGLQYYIRTVQFFITGLFISE